MLVTILELFAIEKAVSHTYTYILYLCLYLYIYLAYIYQKIY